MRRNRTRVQSRMGGRCLRSLFTRQRTATPSAQCESGPPSPSQKPTLLREGWRVHVTDAGGRQYALIDLKGPKINFYAAGSRRRASSWKWCWFQLGNSAQLSCATARRRAVGILLQVGPRRVHRRKSAQTGKAKNKINPTRDCCGLVASLPFRIRQRSCFGARTLPHALGGHVRGVE
jgi:hypothetical protein